MTSQMFVVSSYRGTEELKTLQRVLHWRARGWAQIWTIPAHSGWVWTECSLCKGLWTGTLGPSQSVSGQTHPGPLLQTQKTSAEPPCPLAEDLGQRVSDLFGSAQRQFWSQEEQSLPEVTKGSCKKKRERDFIYIHKTKVIYCYPCCKQCRGFKIILVVCFPIFK